MATPLANIINISDIGAISDSWLSGWVEAKEYESISVEFFRGSGKDMFVRAAGAKCSFSKSVIEQIEKDGGTVSLKCFGKSCVFSVKLYLSSAHIERIKTKNFMNLNSSITFQTRRVIEKKHTCTSSQWRDQMLHLIELMIGYLKYRNNPQCLRHVAFHAGGMYVLDHIIITY